VPELKQGTKKFIEFKRKIWELKKKKDKRVPSVKKKTHKTRKNVAKKVVEIKKKK